MVTDITVRTGTGATGTTDTMDIMETTTNAEFAAFVATETLTIQFRRPIKRHRPARGQAKVGICPVSGKDGVTDDVSEAVNY